MSTNVRKSAAVRRKQQADPAEQLREAWSNAKEAVRTGNGQFFLGAAKFLVSLLSLLYFKGVIRMAYYSMFYRLEIPQDHRGLYCFLVTMVCIFFGAVMLFTRKQIVTRLVIMCSMPFYLPIILFNYRHLVLLWMFAAESQEIGRRSSNTRRTAFKCSRFKSGNAFRESA